MLALPHVGLAAAQSHPLLADANTVYLGRGWNWDDFTGMAVDRSLRGATALTVVPGALAHTGSPTADMFPLGGTQGAYALRVQMTSTNPGTAGVAITNGGAYDLRQHTDGKLRVTIDGSDVSSLQTTIPGLTTTLRELVIVHEFRPNPSTTGSSDACLSTIRIYNTATGEYEENEQAHAYPANSPTTFVIGASNSSSGNIWTHKIADVWLHNRYRGPEFWARMMPLFRSWPAPQPLASLQQGLIFAPRLSDLLDPISGLQGVADGTTYDAATDSRVFNGSTDRVDWPSVRNVNGEPITISIWCYMDSHSGHGQRPFTIAAPVDINDGLYTQIQTNQRMLIVDRNDGGDSAVQQIAGRTWENQWVHVVVTYTGSNDPADMLAYYNGLSTSSAGTTAATGTPREKDGFWSIGGAPSADTVNWDGRLAAPMVWSRVLTAAEVYNLYQMTGPR